MRSARAVDYWNDLYKKPREKVFVDIDLNGLNGIQKIQFPSGILAICGLNGAGKSTIVSALKDVVGLKLTSRDKHKLLKHQVEATVNVNGQNITCYNSDSSRLSDKGFDISKIKYMDFELSTEIQNYLVNQTNIDELIEQCEDLPFDEKAIDTIKYLVGKEYKQCAVYKFEDIEDFDSEIPFFTVTVDDITYTSTEMGTGEHFLLYLFWCINNSQRGDILIIEEPETFISISSQIHFVDFLAERISKNGISVILTTHSPYILNNFKNESVRIVSRFGKNVSVQTPNENLSPNYVLGIPNVSRGTFFVEDKVALDFLEVLLGDKIPNLLKTFSIDIVNGKSNITERLKFPRSNAIKYKFIGVYDGDVRKDFDSKGLNWEFCFLPWDKEIESVFRDYLSDSDNLRRWSDFLRKDINDIIAILATNSGLDGHDWFLEIMKVLAVDGRTLVSSFYNLFMRDDPQVDTFIQEIQLCIEK